MIILTISIISACYFSGYDLATTSVELSVATYSWELLRVGFKGLILHATLSH